MNDSTIVITIHRSSPDACGFSVVTTDHGDDQVSKKIEFIREKVLDAIDTMIAKGGGYIKEP